MPIFDEGDRLLLHALMEQTVANTVAIRDLGVKVNNLADVVEGTHNNIADVLETLRLHMADPDAHTRENP